MRGLIKILSLGLALFVAVTVAQEWDYFSSRWFGGAKLEIGPEGTEAEAVEAVRSTLALMAHFYSSGGDTRFAERMPAGPELIEEFQADVDYLAKNRRIQDPRLQKLELRSIRPAGEGVLAVSTREFWIHRTFWNDGEGESDPPRSEILFVRYQLVRDNVGWLVLGREFEPQVTE
jgi:hypothetical protein